VGGRPDQIWRASPAGVAGPRPRAGLQLHTHYPQLPAPFRISAGTESTVIWYGNTTVSVSHEIVFPADRLMWDTDRPTASSNRQLTTTGFTAPFSPIPIARIFWVASVHASSARSELSGLFSTRMRPASGLFERCAASCFSTTLLAMSMHKYKPSQRLIVNDNATGLVAGLVRLIGYFGIVSQDSPSLYDGDYIVDVKLDSGAIVSLRLPDGCIDGTTEGLQNEIARCACCSMPILA